MKTDNEIIAEFMGFNKQIVSSNMEGGYKEGTILWHTDEGTLTHLEFDSSWEWLMPVVEKIAKIKYDDGDTAYPSTFGMQNQDGKFMVRFNRYHLSDGYSLMGATYAAVVEFCKLQILDGLLPIPPNPQNYK